MVVEVEQLHDDLVREIVKVNNDSPVRQGKHFYHYGKSFDQVKKDQSTYHGRCDFVCAYLESELIGFIKVVYRGDIAAILQILPKASHHDLRPINALLAKTVEICAAKGMSCLTYGLFNYGTQRDSSLREFKSRNRFEEVLVPRFYIPLTAKGALGLRANLHHGWRGILPAKVFALGVGARTRWYNFKLWLSRRSSMLERPNRNRQMERSIPPAGSKSDVQ